jgi:hypothetical protein
MKSLSTSLLRKLTAAAFLTGGVLLGPPAQAGNPPVPHVMSTADYLEGFADIANWGNSFTNGIGAEPWGSVAVNATGTIPDGQRITTATTTFSTGTSGGVQKGTGNLVLLSTGSTDNSAACAVDLYLDFTGRSAGTLSFDWAAAANSTGNRASSLRVYTSTDGAAWSELAGAAVLNLSNNVAASGAVTAVALPATLDGSPTARIRFYECNGTGGSTGSRAKISIDNVAVTSGGGDLPPVITVDPTGGNFWTGSTVVLTSGASGSSLHFQWQKDSSDLANGGQYSGVNTASLTITGVGGGNAGDYRLVVTNSAGSDQSLPANVTSSAPVPQIDTQPVGGSYVLGSTIQLKVTASVAALNAPALQYVWKSNGVALVEGAHFTGVNTATLTINGLAYADAADYMVAVSNPSGTTPSATASIAVVNSGNIVQWNFNGATNVYGPAPSFGAGVASLVGTTNGFIPPAPPNTGTPYDLGDPNNYWGTSTYPAAGASNKTAGVQFTASTLGLKNIGVSLYTRLTGGSSKYSRLQYTTNGTAYLDFPASSTATAPANAWDAPPRTWSLNGFPGVRNNPNFGIRVVTEFENTATYGTSLSTNYVGLSSTYSTSATVSYDLVTISGEAITSANVPPTITTIPDQTTPDTTAITVNFTVGGNGPFTVTAVSSNQAVIPDYALAPGGTGTARNLTITPVFGFSGVAPILVMVTDAAGDVTTTWFYLTITLGNALPTITQLPHTNTLINTPLSLNFTIGDDGPVSALQLSYNSSNPALLPNSNISITGAGATRTITLTPVAGMTGVAPVEITVADPAFQSARATFTLMVRPSTTVAFNDFFDYPDGPLITGSYKLWDAHGGVAQQMDVTNGKLNITDAESEDVNAVLIGQPYSVSSSNRLYSGFTVKFSAPPTVNGAYFAHFKDNGTFNFRARVWALTNGAAPGMYRIGIGNTSGTVPGAVFPMDLELDKEYTVVTRIVVSNGVSTLWINPTTSASTSVTDNSVVATPVGLTSYAFRQAAAFGTLQVDNLKVGLSLSDVSDVPADIVITGISVAGSAVTVTFDAGATDVPAAFALLGASVVEGTYSPTGALITNPSPGKFQATVATAGATQFYRVKRN